VVVAWALDRERRRGEASNLVESLDTTVQPALGEPGKGRRRHSWDAIENN